MDDEIQHRLRLLRGTSGEEPEDRQELIHWLEWLERNRRLSRVVNNAAFRLLTAGGRLLRSRPAEDQPEVSYVRWIAEETPALRTTEWYRHRGAELLRQPLLTVLLPARSPGVEPVESAIESLSRQTYTNWELLVCGLPIEAQTAPNIIITELPLDQAVKLGRGSYFVFLEPGDLLSPHALHEIVDAVQEHPIDLIYSDEDRIDSAGHRSHPVFKPDWSPDLLLSCMYMGSLFAVSKEALEASGGIRPGFDGAESYDLALRITDRNALVRHIPDILCHRPEPVRFEAHFAGRLALEDTVRRRGWRASVGDGTAPGEYDVRWRPDGNPLASLIVCSRTPKLLDQFLTAIQSQTLYDNREVLAVQHMVGPQEEMDAVLARWGVKAVRYHGDFNFSRMNNDATAEAKGDVLVFLNDDIEPLDQNWLGRLIAQSLRPGIGVVGAHLLYPDGTLQHGGMAIGIHDGCGHPARGTIDPPYWKWAHFTREVSAVTGACMAIRKSLFDQLGGFDDDFPTNYNDVDLCLRARKAGYRVLYESHALLRHYECQTRPGRVAHQERERFFRRAWREMEHGDPYYSRNLSRIGESAALRLR